MPICDVVIVGGGIIGTATAFHASRKGARVALIDRNLIVSGSATTHSGGLIRAYHADPAYRKLAIESLSYFRSWGELVGGSCGFRAVGSVVLVGSDDTTKLPERVAAISEAGVAAQILNPTALARLFPMMDPEGVDAAVHEPGGGYADPVQSGRGFASAALSAGAILLEGTACRSLIVRGGRAEGVLTDFGPIAAKAVVLCQNAWARDELSRQGLAPPMTTYRVAVQFARISTEGRTALTFVDATNGLYGRFDPPEMLMFGGRVDLPGVAADAVPPLSLGELSAIRQGMALRFPEIQDAVYAGQRPGVDLFTPDRRMILDHLPGLEGVVLALGTSGSGFKIAPAVGRIVAGLALEGAGSGQDDLAPFRIDRFAPPGPSQPT